MKRCIYLPEKMDHEVEETAKKHGQSYSGFVRFCIQFTLNYKEFSLKDCNCSKKEEEKESGQE